MTAEADIADARHALAAAGSLAAHTETAHFARLGGLTNRVFKVETGPGIFCFACRARVPKHTSTAATSAPTRRPQPKPAFHQRFFISATTA